IMGPETLLPEDSNCALCVSAVLTDKFDVLVSRPSGLQLPKNLLDGIANSFSKDGLELIDINGGKQLVSWSKNEYASVVTIAAELLPAND
ncbi:MAG: hypothetical protein ABJ349_15725, partial [Hyphomicrobiales bacterium]